MVTVQTMVNNILVVTLAVAVVFVVCMCKCCVAVDVVFTGVRSHIKMQAQKPQNRMGLFSRRWGPLGF